MNIASAVARVPCQGITRKRRRSLLYLNLLCKLYISPYYLGAESLLSAPTNNCVKRVKEKIKCEEGNQIKTVHVHSRS